MSPALKPLETSQNSKFDKKLAACTLAGAAALVAPAAAHANSITYVPNVNSTITQPGTYNFDLSGPSAHDIALSISTGTNGPDSTNELSLTTSNGANVSSLFGTPIPLAAGTSINPATGKWVSGSNLSLGSYDTVTDTTISGPWNPGQEGFLGFYFAGTKGPQAGWADISIGAQDGSLEVLSYAYENDANLPIRAGQTVTPEPSTLTLLALGAAGLMALRRRRAVAL